VSICIKYRLPVRNDCAYCVLRDLLRSWMPCKVLVLSIHPLAFRGPVCFSELLNKALPKASMFVDSAKILYCAHRRPIYNMVKEQRKTGDRRINNIFCFLFSIKHYRHNVGTLCMKLILFNLATSFKRYICRSEQEKL